MRLRRLIAPPAAVSLLAILTGCALSRTPPPALSIAAIAVSAGGPLGAHLLITMFKDSPPVRDVINGWRLRGLARSAAIR